MSATSWQTLIPSDTNTSLEVGVRSATEIANDRR